MKYERFEDLPVWRDGMALCERLFQITEDKAFSYKGDLRSQLQRAALSVCNNIAEGFERGTTQELLTFLYIARGSAGEVRSMLLLAERLRGTDHLKSEISNLKLQCEAVSRQLRGWAAHLQDGEIKGQWYLTSRSRAQTDQKKRAEAFSKKLDDMLRAKGLPVRPRPEDDQDE